MNARRKCESGTRGKAGFTLIEVLLVVAILGILAGIVAVNFGGKQRGAMIKATRASIAAVCTATDMYEVDMGQYPASLNDLIKNPGGDNWNGPYLRGELPEDAWGVAFGYKQQGNTGYTVTSAGPDKQMGSDDDITSF